MLVPRAPLEGLLGFAGAAASVVPGLDGLDLRAATREPSEVCQLFEHKQSIITAHTGSIDC